MKTIYRPIFMISFFFLFLACEKEEDFSSNPKFILGVWFNESPVENTNQISRLEYHFKADQTVEIARKIIDASSHQLLGYRQKSSGNYIVEGQQLTMFNLHEYNNDRLQGYYADEDALIPVGTVEESRVNISFNRKKDKLTLKYTSCGLGAICIGHQTFYRE